MACKKQLELVVSGCFFIVPILLHKSLAVPGQPIYAFSKDDTKSKRKVQGVPQSQTAALSRYKGEEETDKTKQNKHKSNKRTKSTKISSLFPKRGNRNSKRTAKHKNKNNTRLRHKTNRLVE